MRLRRSKSTWIYLLFFFAFAMTPPLRAQPIRFKHLTIDDGLSQNSILNIERDSKGYMWFGTSNGLNKYDGYTITTYKHVRGAPTSLSNSEILALLEDSNGKLWIGTGGGINSYDPGTDAFTHYLSDQAGASNLATRRITEIIEDRNRALWVSSRKGGVFVLEPQTGSMTSYTHSPVDSNSLSSDGVFSLFEDREGIIWIGTYDEGLNALDPETGSFTRYKHDPSDPKSLGPGIVATIYQDDSGTLWVGTDGGGLNRFEPSTKSFVRYVEDLSDTRVRSIYEDRSGLMWIGTRLGGLNRFDRKSEQFSAYRHDPSDPTSLSDDSVLSLYEDHSGVLWIGTDGGGVNRVSGQTDAFAHYHHSASNPQSLSDNVIHSLHEDSTGALWVGTRQGALNKFIFNAANSARGLTGVDRVYSHDPSNPQSMSAGPVRAIYQDRQGILWIGIFGGGLDEIIPNDKDRDHESFIHHRHDPQNPRSLSSNNIRIILEDRHGTLWVGTEDGGINRMDRSTGTFERFTHDPGEPESISGNGIRAIYEDSSGALWIGTRRNGLNLFDEEAETFKSYQNDPDDPSSLSHMAVFSISEDERGALWVGTFGGGLNKLNRDTGTFRVFTIADGLPNDVIYGILPDDQGHLWLSTNMGLSRFDPLSESFTNFDKDDGLQSNEFNGGAYHKGHSGTLYFGGINGFNSVFPGRLRSNDYPPPVVLTAFKKQTQEGEIIVNTSELSSITLAYDDLLMSFSFAALDYHAPGKNRYAYRLEGLNDSWIDIGTKREITFSSLAPGAYRMHVKGSNNDGVWNENGVTLAITVNPPYWSTWWFRTLSLLGLFGLLLGVYLLRTYSIRAHNRKLQAEIRERKEVEIHRADLLREKERLLDEMGEKNTTLEKQNAELERFAYTVSHDLKNPLVTIRGFAGMLRQDAARGNAERIGNYINRIETAAGTMGRLLDELLEYSRIGRVVNPPEEILLSTLAEQAVDSLSALIAERGVRVEVQAAMPMTWGDQARLHEVFQNLIENAVKFVGNEPVPCVVVGARPEGNGVVCWVKDNGLGIETAYQERVFGLFERLDQNVDGTGIGLALVKRIVEHHGGRVWVESEGKGQGSTFYFTLPNP